MADNFTFPGGVNTYVPTLHQDLIIEFSLNAADFPINRYINRRKVDKMKGYYIKFRNDSQGRYLNATDSLWPDGNDAPQTTTGNDSFDYPQYECVRRNYAKVYGYLAVEQGAWDIMGQGTRLLAQQAMTARSRRVHGTITTAANWAGNSDTATNLGGGAWSAATPTNPYIRSSLMAAFNLVRKGTYASVQMKDCYVVINPNTARAVATSQEFIDTLKQQPGALAQWQGQEQFQVYGLPENLFGLNVVVDDTVYTSTLPGASTQTFNFSFPDNYSVIMTKQQAVKPSAGGSFSTFELFTFQDMEVEVYNDIRNRRYEVRVIENVDDTLQGLVAPSSGYLISIL